MGLLMYGLVCYVVAGVTVLFEDMGAAQFKDFTTRQRAVAFAWAPAFFLCYVARRSYRWVRYGSDP